MGDFLCFKYLFDLSKVKNVFINALFNKFSKERIWPSKPFSCVLVYLVVFVCFKKYYQRTLFDTDGDYLRYINDLIDKKIPYRLFTMGHSLDITDKDIIEELFRNASEIVVLYHNFDAKKSYITNLVKIFGKDEFDLLKKDKKLSFVSLDDDFKSIKDTLSQESQKDLEVMLCGEIGEPITVV